MGIALHPQAPIRLTKIPNALIVWLYVHSFLHRFVSWEDHQDGLSKHFEGLVKGGEAYWSACIHRALVDLGFEVEITNNSTVTLHTDGDLLQIFLCKVRMMNWWPGSGKETQT